MRISLSFDLWLERRLKTTIPSALACPLQTWRGCRLWAGRGAINELEPSFSEAPTLNRDDGGSRAIGAAKHDYATA